MTSKDAPREKPKKPLTFYFQFRQTRLKELEGQPNRTDVLKEEWEKMPQETKDAENAKFKKEVEKYNVAMAEWKKSHPNNDEERSKPKKKKGGDDEDDEEEKPKKGDKSLGAPKAAKGGKKEEEKEEKGKSKGKKEERGESKKPKK